MSRVRAVRVKSINNAMDGCDLRRYGNVRGNVRG